MTQYQFQVTSYGAGLGCTLDANESHKGCSKAQFYTVHKLMATAYTPNHAIRYISPAGDVTTFVGSPEGTATAGMVDETGTNARFNSPVGLALSAAGILYVADTLNHAVRQVTPQGVVMTFAGSITSVNGYIDALGTNARLSRPTGLAVSPTGIVYVAERINNVIRAISVEGVVTTYAGNTNGLSDHINGRGTSAYFFRPLGVALDTAGNLYVADASNNGIRIIYSTGKVDDVAGSSTNRNGFVLATGTDARFNTPSAVALDPSGNLYVADSSNNCIRILTRL
jgi:sugar lactone lactonase YvrE